MEETLHESVGKLDARGTLLNQLLFFWLIFVVGGDDFLQHWSTQIFAHVTQLQSRFHPSIKLPLEHFEVLEDVETGSCILVIAFGELGAEEFFEEFLEMLVDEFTAPFAAAAGWEEFVADELFLGLAFEFMDGDVDCATTAIKNHNN